jgi:hypothetical protein
VSTPASSSSIIGILGTPSGTERLNLARVAGICLNSQVPLSNNAVCVQHNSCVNEFAIMHEVKM